MIRNAAFALLVVLLATTALGQEPAVQVTVTADELAEQPASPLIFGGFIESGFGRQVEGMWAEMLFNRGFEPIPPYTRANYGSRGCGPDTDLPAQPWWHSGYEEQPWELAPGNPDARWSNPEHLSFWNGQRGGWLENKNTEQWAGVAQRGIHLRRGERYTFTGMLRTGEHAWDTDPDDRSLDAEIRLYAEDDWSTPILTGRIENIRKGFRQHTCTLDNPDFEGRAAFSIWIRPESSIGVDALSLMPASNVDGWRADVVEVAKHINPRIIRWPGGCFASFYHWRDGIGPRNERRPLPSWFWGGLYDNDVGTAEFVQFCRFVNAEPFICVNVLTADADEAADWVAYCNAPATHPVGRLRARDGFAEPFGVKYWELDNEACRRFDSGEYARRCVGFARAMRAVDPEIEIAIVGYDWYRLTLAEMLEIAGGDINFVVDRAIDERALRDDLKILRRYNEAHGTHIRLCNTEWPAPERDVPATVDHAALDKITTAKGRRRCWYSALNVAKTLLTFQRLGGDFAFGNFNNFANTWGQNTIECLKDAAYPSPAGHVFALLSRSPAARALKIEIDGPAENVIVQTAWDESRLKLCLVVLNYTAADVPLSFDLKPLGCTFQTCEMSVLRADSLTAYNTRARPRVVERTDSSSPLPEPTTFSTTVPPFALLHAVLE
ncbi:MAG: alpha-L-arabinofuranosidase C-terminal domain-containing protein [Phycisphaerae bacterium]